MQLSPSPYMGMRASCPTDSSCFRMWKPIKMSNSTQILAIAWANLEQPKLGEHNWRHELESVAHKVFDHPLHASCTFPVLNCYTSLIMAVTYANNITLDGMNINMLKNFMKFSHVTSGGPQSDHPYWWQRRSAAAEYQPTRHPSHALEDQQCHLAEGQWCHPGPSAPPTL